MTRAWRWAALPLAALFGVVGVLFAIDPFGGLDTSAPPVERLTVERTVLDANGIALKVRAGGTEPLTIAQVQVDGAYWRFAQDPPGPVARLGAAWIRIPYPWVQGETHEITIVTGTGVTFGHTVEVALATPTWSLAQMGAYAWIGLMIGVVPVSLGMLFFPIMRRARQGGTEFALALTIGLLAFLFVDTLAEGLELARKDAPAFQAAAMVWLAAGLTFIGLLAVARRGGRTPQGVALATYIALGIGLHNLGEGLAVGAAFAVGEVALGAFLVIGFILHNVTEGIGIVAPLTAYRPRLAVFAGLAALAGLPAVLGIWIGSVAFSSHWAVLFLGIGAGAIARDRRGECLSRPHRGARRGLVADAERRIRHVRRRCPDVWYGIPGEVLRDGQANGGSRPEDGSTGLMDMPHAMTREGA